MKKLFSIVLAVIVSFFCCFTAFATVDLSKSSGFVDKSITVSSSSSSFHFNLFDLFNFLSNYLNSLLTSEAQKIEAARTFYFYKMLIGLNPSGLPIIDDSKLTFSDDYLEYHFNYYWDSVHGALKVYDSDGDIFLRAAGFDEPFCLNLLSFYIHAPLVSHGGTVLKESDIDKSECFSNFKDYYNTLLARFLLSQGFGFTDPNPGKSGLDIAPAYVTSEELIEGIEKDNSVFSPKGELCKISYRTDETFQKYINFPTTPRTDYYKPFLVDNNNFVHIGSTTSNSLYFVLFYKDTKEYISEYQFRLYFDSRAVDADDGTKDFVTFPRLQIWSNVDGSPSDPIDFLDGTVDCSEYKYYYLSLSYSSNYFTLYGFKTYSDYLNNRYGYAFSKQAFTNYYNELFRSDFSSSVKYTEKLTGHTSHSFAGSYSYHDKTCSCPLGGKDDIGLYVSAHPIEFTYADIDTSKIPTGQIVTINGDTIYNYTITNPETGDSSKFGDYITNNYTYITNNYGGDSGGSGVGGNVTVGGQIDVGGSVGVDITVSVPDININVNGNGSGAGGSGSSIANPDDFTSAESVDLTKYYDEAVEQSTGFQKFLKDFFGFLPAELLALILFAVALAIVCRVFGR